MSMPTRYRILERLREHPGAVVSGGELAAELGVSRTAVWKQIAALQQEGYQIEPAANKGYCLYEQPVFSAYEVERRLKTDILGKTICFLDTVDSTNLYAKKIAAEGAENGTVVIAKEQTSGRGRLSRPFVSPPGTGVYLTILLRPEISVADLNLVTLLSALAAADAIEELSGVRPGIKWTNDLFLGGRKICGILTECSVEGESGLVSYAVVGIGMNLLHNPEDFPPELREIAASVKMQTGVSIDPADYAASLLDHFEKYFYRQRFPENRASFLEQYRRDLFFLGQKVQVCGLRESYPATALDVDDSGCLLVRREDGSITALNSGEISIRF